jgi:flagellar hook protein FlgE
MSLSSAMLAGVAGLQSNSSALAAISENIANVNTVGYKTNKVNFETLVTNQSNAGTYDAGGVATVNQQFVTQQGSATQTQSPTDLAIAGQGMFVVSSTPSSPGTNGQALFTRAGSFTTDAQGFLKNSAGLYLMGWAADAQGNISTSTAMSSLQPINITALSGQVSATTTASMVGNLNAAQTISAAATAAAATPVGAGAYDAVTNSMTNYSPSSTPSTGVKPDFTMQIPVSDSLGGQHTLQIDFLKDATTPNTWYVEIQDTANPSILTGGNNQIASGNVTFGSNGALSAVNLTGANVTAGGTLTAATLANGTSLDIPWATSTGLAAQTLNLNLSALTQFASTSEQQQVYTNGTTFGSLSSISVDKNGYVTAAFDNGTSRQIAQIAMATFPNESGLLAVSGNAYEATTASGNYNLKPPGVGGAGTIASSALEASTVDLSTEFTNLITTQSAYSAASKVITTADNMTQALLAIIR